MSAYMGIVYIIKECVQCHNKMHNVCNVVYTMHFPLQTSSDVCNYSMIQQRDTLCNYL